MNLKLINKKIETENIKTFIFESAEQISWTAGQYLIYSLPHENSDLRGKQRFFTISAAPYEKFPSITTRIEKSPSTFKKALDSMRIGDIILAKDPDGDFVIEDFGKAYVFIAGGIGINPYRSILKQMEHEKKNTKINLVYGTSDKETLFENELKELADKNKNVNLEFVQGRITTRDLKKFAKDDFTYYVSGPDPMVEEMEKILEDLGVGVEKIKTDYFSGYQDY